MGQASDGDVVTANLDQDYNSTLIGAETIQDADRLFARLLASRFESGELLKPSTAGSNSGSKRAPAAPSKESFIPIADTF